jgi:CYTH domain-containing protein
MGLEIERKFLIDKSFNPESYKAYKIRQGYFQVDDQKVTRIRTYGDKAYLTLKAKLDQQFKVRKEFEYEIPYDEAEALLKLCQDHIIEKTRYLVPFQNKFWEVDIFHGLNKGLFVAEIELSDENEEVELPSWIKLEVTEDPKYINSYLSKHPFTLW